MVSDVLHKVNIDFHTRHQKLVYEYFQGGFVSGLRFRGRQKVVIVHICSYQCNALSECRTSLTSVLDELQVVRISILQKMISKVYKLKYGICFCCRRKGTLLYLRHFSLCRSPSVGTVHVSKFVNQYILSIVVRSQISRALIDVHESLAPPVYWFQGDYILFDGNTDDNGKVISKLTSSANPYRGLSELAFKLIVFPHQGYCSFNSVDINREHPKISEANFIRYIFLF